MRYMLLIVGMIFVVVFGGALGLGDWPILIGGALIYVIFASMGKHKKSCGRPKNNNVNPEIYISKANNDSYVREASNPESSTTKSVVDRDRTKTHPIRKSLTLIMFIGLIVVVIIIEKQGMQVAPVHNFSQYEMDEDPINELFISEGRSPLEKGLHNHTEQTNNQEFMEWVEQKMHRLQSGLLKQENSNKSVKRLGNYWDNESCEINNFPLIYKENVKELAARFPQFRRPIIALKVYCSRAWNLSKLGEASSISEQYNLLPKAWGNKDVTDMHNMISQQLPDGPAYFINIFQSLIFVYLYKLPNGEEIVSQLIGDMSSKWPTPPTLADVRSAAKYIDLSMIVTDPSLHTRSILLRDNSPAIRVITDIGWEVRLEDIAIESAVNGNVMGLSANDIFAMFSSEDHDYTWPHSSLRELITIGILKVHIALTLQERDIMIQQAASKGRFGTLKNLDVLMYHGLIIDCDIDKNEGRSGDKINARALYCPGESTLFIAKVHNNNSSTLDKDLKIFQIPPEFFHEYAHYYLERETTRKIPFLAEGQATAIGEFDKQNYEAGLSSANDPKMVKAGTSLFANIFDGGQVTDEQIEEARKIHKSYYDSMPFTSTQHQLICLLDKNGIAAKDIVVQISHDNYSFETQKYVNLSYARGWGIYHVSKLKRVFSSDPYNWEVSLESMAKKVMNGELPNEGDMRYLANITDITNKWVKETVKDKEIVCI